MKKILALAILGLVLISGVFLYIDNTQEGTKIFCGAERLEKEYTQEVKCYEYKNIDGEYKKIREVKA